MTDYEALILARQEAQDFEDDADDFEDDCTSCGKLEQCRDAAAGLDDFPVCPMTR